MVIGCCCLFVAHVRFSPKPPAQEPGHLQCPPAAPSSFFTNAFQPHSTVSNTLRFCARSLYDPSLGQSEVSNYPLRILSLLRYLYPFDFARAFSLSPPSGASSISNARRFASTSHGHIENTIDFDAPCAIDRSISLCYFFIPWRTGFFGRYNLSVRLSRSVGG